MKFRDKLVKLEACSESLKWVKNKTIEEAWETCENSDWMIWVLSQTDLDLIDPLCDMVERVSHLVPEKVPEQVCLNAIAAARRRAPKEELYSAARAAHDDSVSPSYLHFAAGCLARYAAFIYDTGAFCYASSASDIVSDALNAAANAARYADGIQYGQERKKQCDILRKYFTIEQVQKAFNKLVT